MLVLTRKAGESIVIGGDVELTVLEIDGDHIRLGIQAPRTVPIYRAELWAEIQRENTLASSQTAGADVALSALTAGGRGSRPTVRLRSPAVP
ncbi:MAG: carbon storage regulator CsrA [Dehalococcoidia bacterium]